MKTTNARCRPLVQARLPFKANHIFAKWIGDLYVVYSYGLHWPLFVWHGSHENGRWYENEDGYSRTTSKHRSQAHPLTDTEKLSTAYLRRWIDEAEAVAGRLTRRAA